MFVQAVRDLVETEYRERGQLLLRTWREVLAAQNLVFTNGVAGMIHDELEVVLGEKSDDVRETYLRSPSPRGHEPTHAKLEELRGSARQRIEADINYATLTPLGVIPGGPAARMEAGSTHHTVYNLTGPNTRVNISSQDESQNVVNITPPALFRELRNALETRIEDAEVRGRILARLDALEQARGTPSFGERYVQFMAAAADHATVLGPYLPALAQMLLPR